MIDRVRRRVSDFKDRIYADTYYQDAIVFALGKLSFDTGESYTTAAAVPVSREFLLTKLATIEMCYIRAADASQVDPSDDAAGAEEINSLSVPGLTVSSEGDSATESAEFWTDLGSKLQEEYDGEIGRLGVSDSVGDIELGQLNRKSLTNGGLASRKLDRGLAAVTPVASADGTSITLAWTALYTDLFYSYEVYRDTLASMASEEKLTSIYDNHTVEYIDTGLSVGTYYYRVKSVNPNEVKTNSAIVSAEVI